MLTPDYYNKFTCIADKCPITCCKEWKIAVDADTNRRWKKLLPPDNVPECRKNLSAYTTKKDGQHVIGLDAMPLGVCLRRFCALRNVCNLPAGISYLSQPQGRDAHAMLSGSD